MLRLRPYKACDAKTIVSWCKDEFLKVLDIYTYQI